MIKLFEMFAGYGGAFAFFGLLMFWRILIWLEQLKSRNKNLNQKVY